MRWHDIYMIELSQMEGMVDPGRRDIENLFNPQDYGLQVEGRGQAGNDSQPRADPAERNPSR
jgi:hypothetical protein